MEILSPEASETYHSHTVLKGLPGEGSWPIHSLAVVIRAPAGTINVHMLWVVADRLRLHHVCDIAIQHPHTFKAERSKLVTHLQQTRPKHSTQTTSANKEYIYKTLNIFMYLFNSNVHADVCPGFMCDICVREPSEAGIGH